MLSLTTTGVKVSISWTAVPGATGYKLLYAPYPYTGPETIGNIDMGTQTNLSGDLWEGAAFYVAVKAYGSGNESGFSNIEYFVIPSTKVGVFYYPWYGNPAVNEHWVHWEHGNQFYPPLDITSDYYPILGAYSSSDPAIVSQHLSWLRDSKVGVIITSWWGQGSREDKVVPLLLETAQKYGIKVAFHIEPYQGRTESSLISDINYLYSNYGNHPAFYRSNASTRWNQEDRPKGVFFVWAIGSRDGDEPGSGVSVDPDYWKNAVDAIHSSSNGGLVIANSTDPKWINQSHFDGLYNYITLHLEDSGGFSWARGLPEDSLYIPSVIPGNSARRIGYPESTFIPRENGNTYTQQWSVALGAYVEPFMVTITSFNEWHEGSQIEPAAVGMLNGFGYSYKDYGDLGPSGYLNLTSKWVDQYLSWNWPRTCRLKVIISTTSDWTTVTLTKGGSFLRPEIISLSPWVTDGKFDGSKFLIIQPLATAESGKTAEMIFDICLSFDDPQGTLSFDIGRGHLGTTRVKINNEEGEMLAGFTWSGIDYGDPTKNARTVEIPVSNLICSEE